MIRFLTARIGNYATLRRRSALFFQHYEKENRSTDLKICNPCPPTFLLPISPAGQWDVGTWTMATEK